MLKSEANKSCQVERRSNYQVICYIYWRYRMKKILVEEAKKAILGMLLEVAFKLLAA